MVEQNIDIINLNFVQDDVVNLYDTNGIYNKKYPSDTDLSAALQGAYASGINFPALGIKQGPPLAGYEWINDLSMMPWVRAVIDFYGQDVPQACGMNCKTWGSRSYAYKFGAAVKYFKQFGYTKSFTQDDCQLLSDVDVLIEKEKTAVNQNNVNGSLGSGETGESIAVLNDLQSYFANNSVKLNCATYLADAESQKMANQSEQERQQILQDQQKADTSTNYLIYGMIGVVVLIAGILIIKRL